MPLKTLGLIGPRTVGERVKEIGKNSGQGIQENISTQMAQSPFFIFINDNLLPLNPKKPLFLKSAEIKRKTQSGRC
jgi:hypothetical protein